MKRRWKGLCALWTVLALVVGTSPMAVAGEDVYESTAIVGDRVVEDETLPVTEESSEDETLPVTEELSEDETLPVTEESNEDESSSEEETKVYSSVLESTQVAKEETTTEEPVEGESVEGLEERTWIDGASVEESTQESSSEEILETEGLVLLESMVLPVQAEMAAREVGTSGEAWLYVGNVEITLEDYVGNSQNNDIDDHRKQIMLQFDQSFNQQEGLKDISVPANSKLNGWKLWGFNESGYVKKDLGELGIGDGISANEYQNFNIDGSAPFLLILPLWRNIKDILTGDSLVMGMSDDCVLSGGTWQVEGDATIYVGETTRTVYAARGGTFTFHKKE